MIDTEKDNREMVERAFLIGIQDPLTDPSEAKEHLWELKELVGTLGIPVIDRTLIVLKQPRPRFLLGSGKVEEIHEQIKKDHIDCLIFDCDISPSQQRNWEKLTGICVIDRQEVILDIFARRASTREAIIQVDLARMQYSLPRLTRAWTHLSRQRGGAKGTRGEGEQQIEVDKRIISQKIAFLQKELKKVRKHRQIQRKQRIKHEIPQVTIIGYTNAGKSSLLNRLTGAGVFVEDKLFATLDPTTRRIRLPMSNRDILLTDTVGFIRKLPHTLVAAFKSTIEEAVLADYLIHVLDISNAQVDRQYTTTLAVLHELGAVDKEIITVFNKVDLVDSPLTRARVLAQYPDCIFISSLTGEGLDSLIAKISFITGKNTEIITLKIPPSRHDVCSKAHRNGKVLSLEYDENGWILLKMSVNRSRLKEFGEFTMDAAN